MVYDAYNLSAMGNTTGIVPLMQTINENLMFHFFGIGILLTVFLISLFAFLHSTGGNTSKSLAASSFICFAISLLLVVMELISGYVVYLTLVMSAISIVFISNE